MSILHTMSDEEKSKYKADKLKEMRDYNSEIIKDLDISPFDFNMKTQFYDEQGRLVVGIFPSEFKKTKGFYFELITSDLNPADTERKVYRIAPSNTFDEEYSLNSKGSYLVPIEELRIVNRSSVAISKFSAVKEQEETNNFLPGKRTSLTVNPDNTIQKAPPSIEDALYSEMTIRDFYAIYSNKPVSTKTWLNNLIKK